jgi:antitoxin (DNA-binding transcriptional repressor) of toxin-antitoxin stability system
VNETVIELGDAARRFAELTALIRAGKVITLCDADQPVAEIRPLPPRSVGRRAFGLARGRFTVPEDFGKPDPEIEGLFYGVQP